MIGLRYRTNCRRTVAMLFLAASAVPAFAQASFSQSMAALKELGLDPNLIYAAIGLVVLLVFFYISLIIFKKMRKGKSVDVLSGVTYLDVTGMGKQGLLTPEEMARVRQSMSRQLARKSAAAASATHLPVELALMADPEVQRLEKIAEEKAKQKPEQTVPAVQPPPPQEPVQWGPVLQHLTTPPDDRKQEFPDVIDPLDLPMPGVPTVTPTSYNTDSPIIESNPTSTDDVPLPPDVLKMAELGLISEEEIGRIKDRIRAKRQQL